MVSGRPIRTLVVLLVASLAASPGEAAGRKAADVARDYVQRQARALGLVGSDVAEVVVSSAVPSRHNGVTHVYLQQRYRGIDVHNGIASVNVRADGKVLSAGNRFVANIAAAAGSQRVRKAAPEAVTAAAERLNVAPSAAETIESRLVWLPVEGGVRLAWSILIEEASGDHWWNAFIDAETGETLALHDLIVQDSAQRIAEGIARPAAATPRAAEGPASLFPDIDGASYKVFPLPFESPTDGPRSLVTGAADPDASPFGWHDTDGAPGAEFTRTRGNNVHAYVDADLPNNEPDPGSDPDGGAGLTFDFTLDLGLNPPAYRPAAVTNLFYWNNVVHDIAHGYGFDEAAGNFQVNNYGNGGLGNDDVRAEAQDRSGTNNANFGTPVDGLRPRMQMFVWTHPRPNTVSVATGGAAGDYEASGAAFGPTVTANGPVTGEVVLVNDGVVGAPVPPAPPGTVNDGCEPFVGVSGKIALLERGFCTFVIKVKNAQNAGALAVIVANNVAGLPITMGGADPTIIIPSVMVSLDNANLLRANLPLVATIRPDPTRSINRDSDLDAGVIAHEYGHGISNRLTGGPANVSCLQNAEQMGEGWSDWFAMTSTTHPSDTATTPRGVGTYVIYEPADGRGIRPTQYTTDMSVNPSTYASVADVVNISQPHGIGYVWNTMLWEVYWNLVDRHGYNADLYGDWTTGGNNRALQFVMDGMKFQPCSPGFVDGRNAILQADLALTGGKNRCEIWRGFAKRGLGASANQGLSTSRTDGTQAFDLPATCTAAVFGGFQPPVDSPPAINNKNAGATVPLKFTLSGAGNSWVIDSQPVDCDTLVPTGEAPIVIATAPAPQHGNRYHINWRTDPSWEGTCRRLTLRIPGATDAVAYFSFH
jgi:extracellular elastinolytic metalloproteinase